MADRMVRREINRPDLVRFTVSKFFEHWKLLTWLFPSLLLFSVRERVPVLQLTALCLFTGRAWTKPCSNPYHH